MLLEWFKTLKDTGEWELFITPNNKLKVSMARAELGKIQNGPEGEPWNNDYFKARHWSQEHRENFEKWVLERQMSRAGVDKDLFGGQLKEDLGLPLYLLRNVDLPKWLNDLILGLAEGRQIDKKEISKLQRRKGELEVKLLTLETMQKNLFIPARNAVDEHYMGSVRTLRYGAGMDIDLSKEDLFGEP